jgi:hypothetical protein
MAQERRPRSEASGEFERSDDRASSRPDGEAIRQRAYERFHERGGEHGRDWEDWLEAERELSEGVRRR